MFTQVGSLQGALVSNVTSMLTKVTIATAGLIMALIRGWKMSLVMIAFLPVSMISGWMKGKYHQKYDAYHQKKKTKIDAEVMEVFDNVLTVKYLDG